MTALRRSLAALTALLVVGGPLRGQTVRGSVVNPDSSIVAGAIVVVQNDRGATVGRVLTGASGLFSYKLPAAGRYSLQVLRIGYRPTIGPVITVGADGTESVRIVLSGQAVVLSAINVRDRGTCRVAADSGLAVTRVWEEARKAMLSSGLQADRVPLVAEWIEYDRQLDSTARIVRGQKVRTTRSPTTHAFKSVPADVLDTAGYVVTSNGVITYHAPDANVLLSELFAASHCFRLEAPPRTAPTLLGVSFEPAADKRGQSDIRGTAWLDRASAELRSVEFRFTGLNDVADAAGAGGRVDFLRLGDGAWLINRWNVRMPQLEARGASDNEGRQTIFARRPLLRAVQVTGGEVTRVTRADSQVYVAEGPRVVVQIVERDSLVSPAGATVTLDGTGYRTVADARGLAVLGPVLEGRYTVRVSTPLMDSVGLTAVSREVDARADGRVDSLRLPSARDVLFRACPRDSVSNGEGMLRGRVRDMRATPIANAAVVVTWQRNFDIVGEVKADRVRFTEKSIGALTDEKGSWQVCGVVRDVPLTVRVVADSGSAAEKTRLLADFGVTDLVVRHDETSANRELDAMLSRSSRPAALIELAAFNLQGAPLPDVTLEVRQPKGQTRTVVTGSTGRALIPGVDPGVLEIRARRIGFKPGTVAATVEPGRNTVPIILSEVAAPSLDTVRVVGNRRVAGLGRLDGFEQRRLSSVGGRFISRADIEKQAPIYTTDLLRRVPGVTLTDSSGVTIAISSRGMKMVQMAEGLVPVPCTMQVAVDGILKEGGFNLNSLNPTDIHGIEVYTTATIPPQFNGAKRDSFCGLIVIWTR